MFLYLEVALALFHARSFSQFDVLPRTYYYFFIFQSAEHRRRRGFICRPARSPTLRRAWERRTDRESPRCCSTSFLSWAPSRHRPPMMGVFIIVPLTFFECANPAHNLTRRPGPDILLFFENPGGTRSTKEVHIF